MNDFERELQERDERVDKCLGSLIGGAVGDALGYTVEFQSLRSILKEYGGRGITDYELDGREKAVVSDDTQMSLFTLEGLMNGYRKGALTPFDYVPYIEQSYLAWYATQTEPYHHIEGSRLSENRDLWARRAPGNTCLSALEVRRRSDGTKVSNNSKGCGGVMRIAPIPVYAVLTERLTSMEAAILSGLAAEITHKHRLSTYSSGVLSRLLSEALRSHRKIADREWFRTAVRVAFYDMRDWYGGYFGFDEMREYVNRALDLAESDKSDFECILELGEGWVAEETLAIAVFAVMRYIDDFEKCVVCAVNHDGDSDSTGAVAGNIIGAILGYKAIPEKYTRNLEFHDLIRGEVLGFRF